MDVNKVLALIWGTFLSYLVSLAECRLHQATLADLADTVGTIFGAFEQCHYKCPNEASPKQNPDYKKTANGCGTYGMKFELERFPELSTCCDKHDICYDTCNSKKNDCDRQFKHCIETACEQKYGEIDSAQARGCSSSAKLIYSGAVAMGCEPYLDAQRKSCSCQPGTRQGFHGNREHWRGNRHGQQDHHRHHRGHNSDSEKGSVKDVLEFFDDLMRDEL